MDVDVVYPTKHTIMNKLQFKILITFIFAQTLIFGQSVSLEDTGSTGDHFSLEGALALLKESSSPEDFEQRLNQENNDVNNLDLNEDGDVDYIRVEDLQGDDTHSLVLQISIDENESQDIAVIEIEKIGKENATLQIIGDEIIFGKQKIVEPFENESSTSGHKGGPGIDVEMGVVVNVWYWPSIRFVYAPNYRPWVSPWKYRVYPRWYRPWRLRPVHVFVPRTVRYHRHYRPTPVLRLTKSHRVYSPHRRSSVAVHRRTTVVHTNRHGRRVTGKKTTQTIVVGKRGNKVCVKRTSSCIFTATDDLL